MPGDGPQARRDLLTSEDWELLTTISSPVALAVENAYLYKQAGLRASELERLKDYSENIIESLTVGVAVLDENGRISGWNRICEETFNRTRAEALGKRLSDVLNPKAYETIFPPDTQSDYHLVGEFPIDKPSGEMRIFDIAKTLCSTTPPLDRNHHRLRGHHRPGPASAAAADVGKAGFHRSSFGGVAHEINTPLTGISSYVQMLQKKDLDDNLSQLLGKIEAQTDRVSRIVKKPPDVRRNPSDLSFHRVDLRESLQEIISLIDYKLKAMAIELDIDLAPSARSGPRASASSRSSSISSSTPWTPCPTAAPPAGARRDADGGRCLDQRYRNGNQGTVSSPDLRSLLHDQGSRKGNRLGLSISYAIVNEHEGRIEVQSEIGKGTKFLIFLPKNLDRRVKKAEGS
jgi:nitrogen-specific signal transduction histidine kinase